MLFSAYASYRWAGSKYYVAKITAFVIRASILPVYFSVPGPLVLEFGPCPVLSFPFYTEHAFGSSLRMVGSYFRIHFLPWIIYHTDSTMVTAVRPDLTGLALFLAVNTLAAVFGYWLNKTQIVPKNRRLNLLSLVALGIAAVVAGLWLYNSSASWVFLGFRIHSISEYDAWYFWIFGFTWLTLCIADFLVHPTDGQLMQSLKLKLDLDRI